MVFTTASIPLLKVLDGQQRLATTLMIFSAIRNWLFKDPDFRDDATKISIQLLTRDDIGSKPEPKLTLTPANNVAFQKFVIDNSHISEIKSAYKKTDKQDRNKKLLLAAVKKTSEVLVVLGELNISDEDFKRRFAIHSEKNGKKARYILTSLERQSLQRDGKTYLNELIPGDVTLEHVFPKSPKEAWAAELKNDPKLVEMTNRLGNLCLLTDVNRALGNKSYKDKLAVFEKSRLRMTNSIDSVTYPKWGRTAIEERQRRMTELAVAAWRYP